MTAAPLILVVEDDPSLRFLCRVNLELDGFRVAEAPTEDAARAALAAERPGLVFLDVRLGASDADGLLDELLADAIPVVVVSGTTEAERYRGRARATFRTYDLASHAERDSAVLHSVWDPHSYRRGEWVHKEITGSHRRYIPPWELPPVEANEVDLLVNSHHPRVGVTSWVSMHQQGRRARASIAYRLPREHEVLWIVDKKGRKVAVPAAKIAYVEIGTPDGDRRIGFGG